MSSLQQIAFDIPSFVPALPEIFVLTMGCIILLVDVGLKQENRMVTYWLSQLTLVSAAMLTLNLHTGVAEVTFHGAFVSDSMSDVLKLFVYLVTVVVFLYSREYLKERNILKGEFFVLGLFAVLGMMIMISAHSMLSVYLGLELLSLSMYAMVAMHRDDAKVSEAAMKYFILGALASGMLLYGMSMVYGITGSLDLAEIAAFVRDNPSENMILAFGIVFLVIGVAFKLGAAPFHMWVPDVYQGAPTAITLFISTAPKIAAFAMLMRLLVDGLGDAVDQWQSMLIILAILSITLGNVIAIAQTNIKRMLAYSGISHVGFLFLGVLSGTGEGYSSAMFYILVYAIMGLASFGMIILLSRAGFEADTLEDFKGLNERSPWFAAMMMMVMFSMAGVPPFVGFYAKLSVLTAVVSAGFAWLAVLAVIFSVIGAFYYLRVVWLMYFEKPSCTAPLTSTYDTRVALSANSLAILALGIFPSGLMALCATALG